MFKVVLRGIVFSIGMYLFLYCSVSFAEEKSVREELSQLKERIQAFEDRLTKQDMCINDQKQCILDQQKKISEYELRLSQFDSDLHRQTGVPIQIAEGLEIGVGGTMIVQGANNVNNATSDVQRKVSRTDASYSTDIAISKEFKKVAGKVFLHLENGQGSGLEDDLTLYSNVNRDADNDINVRLTEFWYEQGLFNNKAVITFGKLCPTAYFDNNDIADDETTQFLSRIFRNSPTIEFADNSAGIRLAYMFDEWIEFGYGIFDADSDWEKIGDNLFNISQVTFKTNFFELPGNYRFYGWDNNVYHTKWDDAQKTKEDSYGFGLSFDQKANDIVTLFARYGWQDPEVYNPNITATGGFAFSLEQSWSAGLQIDGDPWGRKQDAFAFAIGQIFPSDDYKTAEGCLAETEGHIETYYRIHANDHLSISPDFQYIWNPFGKDVTDDAKGIFVAGMRAQLDF